MSEETSEPEGADEDRPEHLETVPDGAGCTEIWDTLSERRENGDATRD
jgi:hypothetical protein